MKWIILAGGSGTRLYPITRAISKQLVPIYDKPMIYYPLSVLMQAWIQDILIITTPEDQSWFTRLLWDGSQWGMRLTYAVQPSPDGLAQAFIIWQQFIGTDDVCLILGDNIFYGQGLTDLLKKSIHLVEYERKSVIFGYEVKDPERYGVVEFDANMHAISIEEKPAVPKSDFAVVGLYFYTKDVVDIAKTIQPSHRWELEITSVNSEYLSRKELKVEVMNRWYAWLDTGTHDSMMDAANYVSVIQKRQGIQIGCPEEVAFLNGWIDAKHLSDLAQPLKKSGYWQYLLWLLK